MALFWELPTLPHTYVERLRKGAKQQIPSRLENKLEPHRCVKGHQLTWAGSDLAGIVS